MNIRRSFGCILIWLFISTQLDAGTTGKIVGKIIDKNTGEALPGANVLIEGTTLGAASDPEGNYFILRIPPGIYPVRATMIGFNDVRFDQVKISTDKTTTLNFSLVETVLESKETVTIVAERPLVQLDLTSTSNTVGAEVIRNLPVESFQDVVNLQAGVVEGHFRGGRSGEVAYMIDGIRINDVYSGDYAISVENEAIQELEIISGTFNAEYGQAMSGVVNIVTKEGGEKFHGKVSGYLGDYLSQDDAVFWNIKAFNPIYNFESSLNGPVPGAGKKLNFFASTRIYHNEGAIYGKEIFVPADVSNFSGTSVTDWYIESHGKPFTFDSDAQFQRIADSLKAAAKYVPMTSSDRYSGHLKLAWRITPSQKIDLEGMLQQQNYQDYAHNFRFNPAGNLTQHQLSWNGSLSWTSVLSERTYFTLKGAQIYNEHRRYVYEDPYDTRYIPAENLERYSGNAFHTGGQEMWHIYRNTTTNIGKFDFTSQLTNQHLIKTGLEFRQHRLWYRSYEIRQNRDTNWLPEIPTQIEGVLNNDLFLVHPYEFSAYLQDKMEFKFLVVNAGIRFDYFNSDGAVPVDFSRPNESARETAAANTQISPRLGLAYPITDRGVIHVSYGHFFQIPNFEYLYKNPEFELSYNKDYSTTNPPDREVNTIGNAEFKPERTVIYEIGVQQQLGADFALGATAFFKDIRNLNGTEVFYTTNGIRYGRYVNLDIGNVRGFTLSFERRLRAGIGATLDYTYQVAKGTASDPSSAFLDAEAGREPEKQLLPLDWDRPHSLNFSVTSGVPDYALSLIGRLGHGLPYTPERESSRVTIKNSERKPFFMTFDLNAFKNFKVANINYSVFLRVYNLFDRKNELNVYSDTGRATYSYEAGRSGTIYGVNSLAEYLARPDFYTEPRQVILGISLEF